MATLAPHRIVAEIPKGLAVSEPVSKAAYKAPAAPDLVVVANNKATSGVATAFSDGEVPRRVSACTNKRHSHRCYCPSSSFNVTIITVVLSLLFLLLLAAVANSQNIIVLPKLGAVSEQIREVSVYLGSSQFPMLLRLVIHDKVHNNWHSIVINIPVRQCFEKNN